MALTEEQVKNIVKEEVKEFFRMGRPGFEILSNYESKIQFIYRDNVWL